MGQRGSRVQEVPRRTGGFTMAALAEAVNHWLAGREQEAFAVLRGAPVGLLDAAVMEPDEWLLPTLVRFADGTEVWFVRWPEDLREQTALPVVSLPVLREFVKAYRLTIDG